MNHLKNQRGYTLIELIAAMLLFSLLVIALVSTLIAVSRSATKGGSQRSVQQEARYDIEEIARVVRNSSIDYAFYAANASTPCSLSSKSFLALQTTYVTATGTTNVQRTYYYSKPIAPSSTKVALYRYAEDVSASATPPSCSAVVSAATPSIAANTAQITPDSLRLLQAFFVVAPDKDPNDPTNTGVSDTSGNASRNIHPRATITLRLATEGSSATDSAITLQTTASSRMYPKVVSL